jgi:hypothetical protein
MLLLTQSGFSRSQATYPLAVVRVLASLVVCLILGLGASGPAMADHDFGQEVPQATPGNPGKVFQTGKDPTANEYGVPSTEASGTQAGAVPSSAPNSSAVGGTPPSAAPSIAPTVRPLRVPEPVQSGSSGTGLSLGTGSAQGGLGALPLLALLATAAGLTATLLLSRRRRRFLRQG